MKMQQVRKKAKALGLKTFQMRKADIIREIQAAEGNYPCFETANGHCDQRECCWREVCVSEPAKTSK